MDNKTDKNIISVSVRNLVEFILRSGNIDNRGKGGQDIQLMLEGARIHRMIQQRMGRDYHPEVYLKKLIETENYDILVDGRADGIICPPDIFGEEAPMEGGTELSEYKGDDSVTIDEIKTLYMDVERLNEPVPVHLAQAKCYAYMFAEQHGLKDITVRMTYVNQMTLATKYFHETYTWEEIRDWFDALIEKYMRWAEFEFEFRKLRNESIHNVEFPFVYREGQRELTAQVYRTIYHGRRLFLEAPTGTGKTVSTVFPSVKAWRTRCFT